MLTLIIGGTESLNKETREFVIVGGFKLELEHSLVSLSKWESNFEKPFLSKEEKTPEELYWYIKAMTLTSDVPDEIYGKLTTENVVTINEYLSAKRTATWFPPDPNAKQSRETITSELIYYWMIVLNIPVQFENWNINRLFTLVEVCNRKNSSPKKMSKASMAQQRANLNAQRRAQTGSTG